MGNSHPPAARPLIAAAALLVVAWGVAPIAAAQTADEFFSGQSLDDVWVHINARDWSALRSAYLENTFYPCDVEWRGVKVRNAGCRSRGFGSRNPIKPGLDIEFDRYVSGQRFLGFASLVLDNLWQDPSMVKERLSMLLFRRMGLAAPRESHVRLFVGSRREFAGVYAAVEPIDHSFVGRELGGSDGYLYEYRWNEAYYFQDLGGDLDAYAMRFVPRTRQLESAFALYAPVRELVAAMRETPLEQLESILDVRGFIRQVAVESFLADQDGMLGDWGLNNFYLYRSTGAPARFIPWDKDTTFADVNRPTSHNVEANVLMQRIWTEGAYRELYFQALREAADASSFLEEELVFEYGQIAAAAMADPFKPDSNDAFVAAILQLVEFVRARPTVVRGYLEPQRQ